MITANQYAVFFICALLAGAFLPSAAAAQDDGGEGEVLAGTCLGCHGIAGYRNAYPSYRVPKLGGQKKDYLAAALRAYRDGDRPHPTMQAQGTTLTDAEIDTLAAHFQGEEAARDTVTADDIAGIDAAQTCLACHGAQASGVVPTPATLSGQHQDYLVHALRQYKNGARPGNVMSAFASMLSEADMEKIARLYSRREGLHTPGRKD
ncbi:MAG: c-type cytochrome [Woeseiaceae bacterium]|nr:c-type cytochrome [Woeseiaceae bacterium]